MTGKIRSFGRRAETAFTLLELLVVLGVVAVLAATLLPALANSKPNSQALQCMNNLREWGNAMRVAAGDNDDMPPRDGTADNGQYSSDSGATSGPGSPNDAFAWFNQAPPMMGEFPLSFYYTNLGTNSPKTFLPFPGGKGKIWHCPTARAAPNDVFLSNGRFGFFSYAMNLDLKATTPIGTGYGKLPYPIMPKMGGIPNPAATVLMTEVTFSPTLETDIISDPSRNGIFPTERSTRFPKRHNAGGVLVFVDGHVAVFKRAYITNGAPNASGANRAEKKNPDVIWNIFR